MDITTLLASLSLSSIIPYVTALIAIATAILLVLPAPTTASSGVYTVIYGAVHLVANLKPAPAPAAAPAPTPTPAA